MMAREESLRHLRARVPRGRIGLLVLGTTASLMLGSGLFALLSDSITIPANSLQSGTYQVAAQDLQIAVFTGTSCADAALVWTDTDTVASSFSGTTVDLSATASVDGDAFCLRNNGTTSGRLSFLMDAATFTDTEVGVCETTEEAAGDTSCSAGTQGELAAVTALRLGYELGGYFYYPSLTTSADEIGDLAPGETVRVWASYFVKSGSTDTQLLVAQTDRIVFDLVFTLRDIPPA